MCYTAVGEDDGGCVEGLQRDGRDLVLDERRRDVRDGVELDDLVGRARIHLALWQGDPVRAHVERVPGRVVDGALVEERLRGVVDELDRGAVAQYVREARIVHREVGQVGVRRGELRQGPRAHGGEGCRLDEARHSRLRLIFHTHTTHDTLHAALSEEESGVLVSRWARARFEYIKAPRKRVSEWKSLLLNPMPQL